MFCCQNHLSNSVSSSTNYGRILNPNFGGLRSNSGLEQAKPSQFGQSPYPLCGCLQGGAFPSSQVATNTEADQFHGLATWVRTQINQVWSWISNNWDSKQGVTDNISSLITDGWSAIKKWGSGLLGMLSGLF